MATVVLAPEPLTRYAVAKVVEDRFGGDDGILRTKRQHAYDLVPALEASGLIRVVGTAPTRTSREPTNLFGATQAGVQDWRTWLSSPITVPEAMTGALARLYAVRQGDFATMLGIIDRYEATLQLLVQRAEDPVAPGHVVERMRSLWSRRELVAQLQWCQHSRDIVADAMAGAARR